MKSREIFRSTAIRWGWVCTAAFAVLSFVYAGYAAWPNFVDPPGVDFVSLWAAGKIALAGNAMLAYDLQAHRAVELSVGPLLGILPFAYPPPFLLVVAPFGLLPFPFAFIVWVFATGAFYVVSARKIAPLPYSLALPTAIPNALIGQTGFLLSGLFLTAASNLAKRPVRSGLLFGCFVMKPQLALAIPLALVAGREWRAIFGATVSVILLLVGSAMLFGLQAYAVFLHQLPTITNLMAQSKWPWNELSSVFAFARFFGVPQAIALIIQAIVAAGALLVTWRAWSRRADTRIPILAAATLLIPPYLFTYDSLLLVVPFGWFVADRRPVTAAIVWLCCLLTVLSYAQIYPGPNLAPIAAIVSLYQLGRARAPTRRRNDSQPTPAPEAPAAF